MTKIESRQAAQRRLGAGLLEVAANTVPADEVQGTVHLAISGDKFGSSWTWVDPDELRDAIDKAVGPREGAESPVAKPYRPIDRDRLLRHIEDVEAALTRRNARHEEDQEKIREVLAQNERLMERIEELEAKAAAPSLEEQIEALEKVPAGYEVVLDPPRLLDTPESREWGVPPVMVDRIYREDSSVSFRFRDAEGGWGWYARPVCALKLGVTAEDFGPSIETRRKEYEAVGLAEWEIEILMGANA